MITKTNPSHTHHFYFNFEKRPSESQKFEFLFEFCPVAMPTRKRYRLPAFTVKLMYDTMTIVHYQYGYRYTYCH